MKIKEFFDTRTSTLTYVLFDPKSKDAIVIDPVLDFDPADGRIWDESFSVVRDFLKSENLNLHWILETHAHADHLTAAPLLKREFQNAKVGVGENITIVQKTFSDIFNMPKLKTDGSQFDRLFKDGEVVQAGTLSFKVLATPGHTPACVSYLIGDCVFTGDLLFIPDSGTGRCDFPNGSAESLYQSVTKKIYALPDSTKIFVGHDYQPGGRPLQFQTTVEKQKADNIHIKSATTEEEFVQFRTKRDKNLSAPKLLLPSIQVNINAGELPEPDSNGVRYFKIPLQIKI